MRTNNITYTRFTSARDIPVPKPTQNIGFGLPNYSTASLPNATASKNGDIAFDRDIKKPVYFTPELGWETFAGNPAVRAYGGLYATNPGPSHLYQAGVSARIEVGPKAQYPTQDLIYAGGGAGIPIVATRDMTVNINASIELLTEDTPNAGVLVFFTKNGDPNMIIGGPSAITLTAVDTTYTVPLSLIAQLTANDFIMVYLQTGVDASILSQTFSITVTEVGV